MSSAERDRRAYELAREYLLGREGVTSDMLDRHLRPAAKPSHLWEVYFRLLETLQNAQMMPNVIGRAIGGLANLRPVMCDFEPEDIVASFSNNQDRLLDEISSRLRPRGQFRRDRRSLWNRFCRGALSGAEFLAQFKTAQEFFLWADFFNEDDRTRPALPLLLEQEIVGLGFPLACDFLKESGYEGFGKPDVQLKYIFPRLGLAEDKTDFKIFKAIVRVARNAGETPYAVDKTFWLVGSGNFYLPPGEKVATDRAEFVDLALSKLA